MWHIYINKDSKKNVRNVIEYFLGNLNPSCLVALIVRVTDIRNSDHLRSKESTEKSRSGASSPCCPSEESRMAREYVTPVSMRSLGQRVFFFNWRVLAWQGCVSFHCTAKQISSVGHVSPLFWISVPFRSPRALSRLYWQDYSYYYSPVVYRFPWAVCFRRSSVYTAISTSHFIPLPSALGSIHPSSICLYFCLQT